ncbi:MAG: TIGR03960 family B12-binding radical SAM protein [Myxococcota bacterium]|nr:TIGR03960 family B12-binding radical SAM protein [Myxococcota bacterium]
MDFYSQVSEDTINDLLRGVDKPARYIGGEVNSVVKTGEVRGRMALCFSDAYEVAESHIGLKILYKIINDRDDYAAERVYAFWPDLEHKARERDVPIWSLETRRPLRMFDLVGFTLQYELSYPTLLAMLDHGGVTLRSAQRAEEEPFVIGGGAGAFNPEPIAPFFDAFLLGDGEEAVTEIMDVVVSGRERGASRAEILHELALVPGVYVPAHFEITYDGFEIDAITPVEGSPYTKTKSRHGTARITRRTVADLDSAPYPTKPIVPNVKPVHERVAIEIQRGCSQACRFCQAGMITRPTRQRKAETVLKLAEKQVQSTGCDEVGLLSLSAGDYEPINYVLEQFFDRHSNDNVSISLPSMRTETMTPKLAEQVATVRKSGFTFAPEAGSERMRRVINKTNKEEDLMNAVRATVKAGWRHLKFYFMIGLPTETFVDVDAIAALGERARAEGRKIRRDVNVTVSVSTFVPKPHTSFQWEAQIGIEETIDKQRRLRSRLKRQNIGFRWHGAEQSFLEGVLSRGDRRLADALEEAARVGCRLDAWGEHHNHDLWMGVFERTLAPYGIEPSQYLGERSEDSPLPWEHLDAGILRKFLLRDRKASYKEATIEDCALNDYCYACGGCDKGDPYTKRKDENGKRVYDLVPVVRSAEKARATGLKILDSKPEEVEREDPLSQNETTRLLFRFAKLGRALHQSHLDIREFILRAMRLSGMPVRYSQGNTPRPKVSFSPACPTGIESEAEYFEADCAGIVDGRTYAEAMGAYLPEGICILNVEEIETSRPAINHRLTSMTFQAGFGGDASEAELRNCVERFIGSDTAPVLVRRKKKPRILDARACLGDVAVVGTMLHVQVLFGGNRATLKVREAIGAIVGAELALAARIRKLQAALGEGAWEEGGEQPEATWPESAVVDLVELSDHQRPALANRPKIESATVPYAE